MNGFSDSGILLTLLFYFCRYFYRLIQPAKAWCYAARIEDTKAQSTGYILSISDNGIGTPENIGFENLDTFGLQLVNLLVDQLNGEIELKRDKGTEFALMFSVE